MESTEKIDFGVFQEACGYGIVDVSDMQAQCEIMRRNEALSKREHSIWQGSNGYWYTYLPDATKPNNRKQVYRRNKQDLEDVIVEFYKQEDQNPTISEVFTEWENRRIDLHQITKSTRSRDERCFKRHFSEFGQRRVKDVPPMEIVDFLEREAAEKQLDVKAINNLKSILKGLLARAKRRGLINYEISSALEAVEIPRGGYKRTKKTDEEEVYNEEEVERIVIYLQENLDSMNIGLLLIFLTGIRVGELAVLTHADFTDQCTFYVNKTETSYMNDDGKYVYEVKNTPKTDAGEREVVIPTDYAWIQQKIRDLNPSGDYIFLNSHGERARTDSFRCRMKTICRKLDIPYRSPHKIRKTYGSILIDNDVNEKIITAQMGHTDIICTRTFYNKDRSTQAQRITALSDIPELKRASLWTESNAIKANSQKVE